MKKIIAKGFEKHFIKSWTGWDQHDTTAFAFYGCEPAEGTNLFESGSYVEINLDNCTLVVYNEEGDKIVLQRNFSLVLEG